MIDPVSITCFTNTKEQLEEVLLFWVLAAGKNAITASKCLENLMVNLHKKFCLSLYSPFECLRKIKKEITHGVVGGDHRQRRKDRGEAQERNHPTGMAFRKFSVGKEEDEGEEREKVSFFYSSFSKRKRKNTNSSKLETEKKTHALLLAAAIATPTIGTRLPHMIHHGNRRNRLQPICGRSDV